MRSVSTREAGHTSPAASVKLEVFWRFEGGSCSVMRAALAPLLGAAERRALHGRAGHAGQRKLSKKEGSSTVARRVPLQSTISDHLAYTACFSAGRGNCSDGTKAEVCLGKPDANDEMIL